GIAVLYCHRSSLGGDTTGRRLLRLSCFLPFLYTFFSLPGAGFSWLMPEAVLTQPAVAAARDLLVGAARFASFAAPVALFFRQQTGGRTPLPLISLLAVICNAVWLVPFSYQLPLVMITATVFRGLSCLAIGRIVH